MSHQDAGITHRVIGRFLAVILPGLLIAVTICPQGAFAVPAYPESVEVIQPDGQRIHIRQNGDEFFSWHETEAGYAIRRDPSDGFWKYARPSARAAEFEIVPGARVGRVDPAGLNLTPKALPNRNQLRQRHSEAYKEIRGLSEKKPIAKTSDDTSLVPSASDASSASTIEEPPPVEIPVSGISSIRNIVILACFNDHWDSGGGTVSSAYGRVATSEYNNLFNQINHTSDGAVGSVRDYYDEVSYGKMTIESVVSTWVHLPQNESYYGTDGASNDTNWKQMVTDAVDAADAAGFDFSQGDSDGDGWVDCLTIIHSGHGQEYSGNPSTSIWSKQGELSSIVTKDGVMIKRCHTEPALRGSTSSTSIIRIGVICHEMGHSFGLPDLYDYSSITRGLGRWGIMASGSWNGSDGKSPAHFCAWSKYMLGFVKPLLIHSASNISIDQVETNPVVHMIRDGMANDEYFLIENREKVGFDNTSEIFAGLLIEHVDAKSANNDLATWPHPVVKIEEADGNDSLGLKVAYSEAGDVWSSSNGLAGGFRDQTGTQSANAMMYQDAHYYNRSVNSAYYGYNLLSDFSAAGDTMTYNATTLKPMVEDQSVSTSGYTVNWGSCTNATQYAIQEGEPVTLTSFTDGAESDDTMHANWYLSGTVVRDSGGAHTGSYSYAMHRYYDSKWYSTVQSLTMQTVFKVTVDTEISFYMLSHVALDFGYLKCQISNDDGETWRTLGTYADYIDPWSFKSFNYSALSAVGISANDQCLLRFVANFEATSGWSGFPGFGYAIDDISITGTEMTGFGNWATLDSNVATTSYAVDERSNGIHAYQVKAYANSVWQDYGSVGTTTIDAPFTVTFQTDGTIGASLSGETSQSVSPGEDCSEVMANAPANYHFVKWLYDGDDYSALNPLTVTNVQSDMILVASFAINQYALSYSTGAGGSLTGDATQTVNYGSSGTAVTAVPDTGYHFVQWSDASTANPRTDTNVTADVTVTASFAINQYALSYSAGAGGSLTGDASQTVNYGSSGTAVTAVPDTGYHFVQWSDASTANPRTDTNVTADVTVTASFAINQYALSYSAGAGGSLTGDASQTVNYGSSGTAVTAVPDTGYHFVQWSDASTANPRTDTNVTADVTVTASFAINQYALSYSAGAGGSLTGDATQTVNYGSSGTAVTAVPDTGYHFVQWSDDSTANPRTDTNVTADVTVTASFAINQYTLTFLTDGTPDATFEGTTEQTVAYGADSTAVTAVPPFGYNFVKWTVDDEDYATSNPLLVASVTESRTFVAVFDITGEIVWVEFGSAGMQLGTQADPFATLADGLEAVVSGGTMRVVSGETDTAIQINQPVRIEAVGGPVRIGVSSGGASAPLPDATDPADTATSVNDSYSSAMLWLLYE